ncbi:MAG: DUF6188 family protein [Thermoleophilia bacterium]
MGSEASWELPLDGLRVVQCRVDYGFTLILGDDSPDAFELRIEGGFELLGGSAKTKLDPSTGPPAIAPALSLLNKEIDGGQALENGELIVQFTHGVLLRVSPSEFEAWTLSGPSGFRFVSLAGGGLGIWNRGLSS